MTAPTKPRPALLEKVAAETGIQLWKIKEALRKSMIPCQDTATTLNQARKAYNNAHLDSEERATIRRIVELYARRHPRRSPKKRPRPRRG